MLKIVAITLMLGCLHLCGMEDQTQIETDIEIRLQQTNDLADLIASSKNSSPEQWLTLIKNCGKLEAALEYNLIKDEAAKVCIRRGIEDLDSAFKTHLKIQQKEAALVPILAFAEVLEKAQGTLDKSQQENK
jgi:hypothetical protein